MSRERYEEGFWPLVVLPLLLTGVGAIVMLHPSAVALAALGALTIPIALTEVIIWRALQAKWAGELDSLWPWSPRLRTFIELLAVYAVVVAAGSPKAHNLNGGTWPEAVLYSALVFGGLATFYFLLWLVERYAGGTR